MFDNEPGITHEELFRVAELIEQHPFQFAKTMPEIPHWYSHKKNWPDPYEYEEVVRLVQTYGYNRRWKNRKYYRSLTLNGHYYWTMGAPVDETTILNRARMHYDTPYDERAHRYDAAVADH